MERGQILNSKNIVHVLLEILTLFQLKKIYSCESGLRYKSMSFPIWYGSIPASSITRIVRCLCVWAKLIAAAFISLFSLFSSWFSAFNFLFSSSNFSVLSFLLKKKARLLMKWNQNALLTLLYEPNPLKTPFSKIQKKYFAVLSGFNLYLKSWKRGNSF